MGCVGGSNLPQQNGQFVHNYDSLASPLENFKDGARSHLKAELLHVAGGWCWLLVENLAGAIGLSKWLGLSHNMLPYSRQVFQGERERDTDRVQRKKEST